jgi:hypothetical protein
MNVKGERKSARQHLANSRFIQASKCSGSGCMLQAAGKAMLPRATNHENININVKVKHDIVKL